MKTKYAPLMAALTAAALFTGTACSSSDAPEETTDPNQAGTVQEQDPKKDALKPKGTTITIVVFQLKQEEPPPSPSPSVSPPA